MDTVSNTKSLPFLFDFKEDYCLENEQVQLRPLRTDDYGLLLPFSEKEPDLWRFNANGANGAENLKRYIEFAIRQREEQTAYPFIVLDKRSGNYVGSTRLYDFQFEKKTVQVGFTWYGKSYHGTGINKDCKFLLLDFAFSALKMERAGFTANAANQKSINAMKSIGCTVEGVLRSAGFDGDGRRNDNIVLSILKSEWENEIKPQWGNPKASERYIPYEIKDKGNALSYTWGNNCMSYVMLETAGLSVKQELMPPGAKERLHFHEKATQVFTIINGEAVFYIEKNKVQVNKGQSLVIRPSREHLIANESRTPLEFFVISQPSTKHDRIDI